MKPIERRILGGAIISDLVDMLPPLPGIDQIEDVIEAAMIMATRHVFPKNRATTALELVETVEADIPVLSPDLLPMHIIATSLAVRKRIQQDTGRWKRYELPKLSK